ILSLSRPRAHLSLHSFPTRRSSDLVEHDLDAHQRDEHVATREEPDAAEREERGREEHVVVDGDHDSTSELAISCLLRPRATAIRSEEHTSELQSRFDLVCRLLLEKK